MSPNRILAGIAVCLAATVSGAAVGFILGGLGICAMDLTPGLIGFAVLIGGVLSSSAALLWPKAPWAGSLAFSIPALLGVVSGVAVGEWQRAFASGLCIASAVLAAIAIRWLRMRHLKPSQ